MKQMMLCHTGSLEDLKRPGWVAEWKWDGARVLIDKENGEVTVQHRNGIIYTRRLPEGVTAAKDIPGDFTIDTEAVYINPKTGREEFTPCQRRCSTQDWAKIYYLRAQYPITFEVFDILKLNGEDLTRAPWIKRKEILRKLLQNHLGTFQYVQHRFDLEDYWEEVKRREGEGLILKDINSPYVHERSYKWLKLKNWRWRTCHVVGYTPGKNARAHFWGSLVLATAGGRFIGCAGSGPNDWELRQIKDILDDALKVDKPFNIGEPYIAVKTDLKVLVKYYQITENDVMRFPVFEKIIT